MFMLPVSDVSELSRDVWVRSCRQQRVKIDDSHLNRTRRKSMENMELVKLTPDKVKFSVFFSVFALICCCCGVSHLL